MYIVEDIYKDYYYYTTTSCSSLAFTLMQYDYVWMWLYNVHVYMSTFVCMYIWTDERFLVFAANVYDFQTRTYVYISARSEKTFWWNACTCEKYTPMIFQWRIKIMGLNLDLFQERTLNMVCMKKNTIHGGRMLHVRTKK